MRQLLDGEAIWLLGVRGSGKSMLIAQLVLELRQRPGVNVIHLRPADGQMSLEREIVGSAKHISAKERASLDLNAFFERKEAQDAFLVVVIDGLDSCVDSPQFIQHLNSLESFRRRLDNLAILVSSRRPPANFSTLAGSDFPSRVKLACAEPFDGAELEAQCSPFGSLANNVAADVLRCTHGQPVLVAYILGTIWPVATGDDLGRLLKAAVGSLQAEAGHLLADIRQDLDRGHASPLLEVLRRREEVCGVESLLSAGRGLPGAWRLREAICLIRSAGLAIQVEEGLRRTTGSLLETGPPAAAAHPDVAAPVVVDATAGPLVSRSEPSLDRGEKLHGVDAPDAPVAATGTTGGAPSDGSFSGVGSTERALIAKVTADAADEEERRVVPWAWFVLAAVVVAALQAHPFFSEDVIHFATSVLLAAALPTLAIVLQLSGSDSSVESPNAMLGAGVALAPTISWWAVAKGWMDARFRQFRVHLAAFLLVETIAFSLLSQAGLNLYRPVLRWRPLKQSVMDSPAFWAAVNPAIGRLLFPGPSGPITQEPTEDERSYLSSGTAVTQSTVLTVFRRHYIALVLWTVGLRCGALLIAAHMKGGRLRATAEAIALALACSGAWFLFRVCVR